MTDAASAPPRNVDLSVDLAGLRLRNPIVTASGCFASGMEIERFYDIADLGAVVVKSITVAPRQGLPPPRMVETPSGMLNAIGLQNPGVDRWLARDLPWLRERGVPVIVSVAGTSVDEYRTLGRKLRSRPGIVAVEANISCPNVEDRGTVFACRPDASQAAIEAVRREVDVPVFAKLTPDVTDIVEIARACIRGGASGLSLINTMLGLSIDVETRRPHLANIFGGLSGPAILPIAVRNVYQVHRALPDVPIIGMGGVSRTEDVVEMIMAGASAVAIGTATFMDPFAAHDMLKGLGRWMAEHGVGSVADLRGAVRAERS